jgi:hypothetical protein
LNLGFNFIENEGGQHIGNIFINLPQITKISIGVGSKNFGYKGLENLIKGL